MVFLSCGISLLFVIPVDFLMKDVNVLFLRFVFLFVIKTTLFKGNLRNKFENVYHLYFHNGAFDVGVLKSLKGLG